MGTKTNQIPTVGIIAIIIAAVCAIVVGFVVLNRFTSDYTVTKERELQEKVPTELFQTTPPHAATSVPDKR